MAGAALTVAEMAMTYNGGIISAQLVTEKQPPTVDGMDPAARTWLLRQDGWVRVDKIIASLDGTMMTMRQALRG